MFEKCSGLKINSEKSESMWLGVKRGCKEQPLNLNWVESIKSLGISLSYNCQTMSQVNFDDKINKMISCLNAWRGRHLTINGRILLAKQLGYSQFQYVSSVLDIPDYVKKSLENILFQFVWKSRKKGKVNRSLLKSNYEQGGQNMLDVSCMIEAQHLMWFKRYMYGSNKDWKALVDYFLQPFGGLNLLCFCDFTENGLVNIPIFYKKMLLVWKKLRIYKNMSVIWNNSKLLVDNKPVFNKNMLQAGMWYISDLFDGKNLLPFSVWSKRGIGSNLYLLWRGIVHSVKYHCLDISSKPIMEFKCKISSKEVSLKNLDSKNVYQELLNSKIVVVNYSKEFYSRTYNLQADQWPDIYSLCRKVSLDRALCEFQYKILHRYLAVNVLLVKYKIRTNSLCTFCHKTDETISHLLYNCVISYRFWTEFQQWLLDTCNIVFDLTEVAIVIGVLDNSRQSKIINKLILIGKYYLYGCKQAENKPHFKSFENKVKYNYRVERITALKNNNMHQFLLIWDKFLHIM